MSVRWRKDIDNIPDLAVWYNTCFERMGGVWYVSPEELDSHLGRMGMHGGENVLDIGCGDGSFLLHAWKRFHISGIGVDLSSWAIERAKDRRDEGRSSVFFQTADAAEFLPRIVSETFDWVVSLGSLEHVLDIGRVLDETHRLLKPGGHWYFYVPNEKWVHEDQPTELTMADAEWRQLFMQHGLPCDQWWNFGDCTAFLGAKGIREVKA